MEKGIDISFKLSNLVDRLSSSTSDMAGKGKQHKVPMPTGSKNISGVGRSAASNISITSAIVEASTPGGRQTTMDTFMTTTPRKRALNTPEDNAAKRAAQDNSDGEHEEWQAQMRNNIIKEVGLTPEQAEKVMKIVVDTFKAQVVREAKKVATRIVQDDYEARRSTSSVIIHRADQWVGESSEPGLNLAEKVTMAIHHLTFGAVAVLDAFVLGRWSDQTPPTAVMVTFGSRGQKTTFFKILAKKVAGDPKLRNISCRDAFPKKLVESAKEIAKKGGLLKTSGEIVAFRVVARGPGCVPVLEVKGHLDGGRREAKWRVYTEGASSSGQGGRRRLPSTPRKGGGSSLSLPARVETGEDFDEIVRLDISEDQICTEEY